MKQQFFRTLSQLMLAILMVAGLAINHAQAQGILGQQVETPLWMHDNPRPDIRVRDERGNPIFLRYTITRQVGDATVIQDVYGAPISTNEPDQSAERLPAVVFTRIITATSDTTCIWDAVGNLVLPGNNYGVNLDNLGTVVIANFVPMGSTTRLPLSESKVGLVGGRVALVETQKIPGLRSAFDDHGGNIFIDRSPDGKNWKGDPLWWAIPMGPGTDPRYNVKGSIEITIIRPDDAVDSAMWLFGYSVAMMAGCGVTPPPPPVTTSGNFLSPASLLCTWSCLSSQGCHGTNKILIFMPYRDIVSDAVEKKEEVRSYLQGHDGQLWAEFVAVQIQVQRHATPWIFNNAALLDLTRKKFRESKKLSFGFMLTPANTLSELLYLIRTTRNFAQDSDKEVFVEILQYINWDTSNGAGSGTSREVYTNETHTGVANRSGDGREVADDTTPVASSMMQAPTVRQAIIAEPQIAPPMAVTPTIELEPVQGESGLTTFRFEQSKTPIITVPAKSKNRTVRWLCKRHNKWHHKAK